MSFIIPPQIDVRQRKEQEEKENKRKQKLDARLYTIIKVARDADLAEQIGKEIYFDLVNHDKVTTFRVKKHMPFSQFKEEVAKAFHIPVQFQRYWLWHERKNDMYRPSRSLTAQEETHSVGQLSEESNKVNNAELNLFLEVELCLHLRPLSPPGKTTKEEILLFFKLYDPLIEKIRYVGRLFVKKSGKPLEILSKLKELAGFSPDEEIDLFEEIKFEPNMMCRYIDSNMSFRGCALEDGDIICFQKSLRNQCSEQYRFPEVPSFLEYMHNCQEQKGKEKAEASLYTMIKVACDEDLGEQIGKDIYFDLVDHDKVATFHIQKQVNFTRFKEEVAKEFRIPVQFHRYWLWAKRQNHTYRPDRALTSQEEMQSVGELSEVSNKWNSDELNLFLEVDFCLDLRPLSLPEKMTKEEILLFFKLYDPLKEKISYVGRLSVKLNGKPLEIITQLKELAGFSPDEEIEFFEEIKFEPTVVCVQINSMLSFRDCKLEDGDIIFFQKSLRNQRIEQYRFPKVPLFLEYVHQPKGHEKLVRSLDFPFKKRRPVEVAPVDMSNMMDALLVDEPASNMMNALVVHEPASNTMDALVVHEPASNTMDALVVHEPASSMMDALVVHEPASNKMDALVVDEPASNIMDALVMAEPASARIRWTLNNFSSLKKKKYYSDTFSVGEYKWRMLILPIRNNTDHLSLFLEAADTAALPHGWIRYAQFSLAVINQIHDKFTLRKDSQHQFNARKIEWGFRSFMPLTELYAPGSGYLLNDKVIFEAYVTLP